MNCVKVKVKFTLDQATNVRNGRGVIAILVLEPRR